MKAWVLRFRFIALFPVRYHLINQAVFFRLFRAHDPVALYVAFDYFHRLSAVPGEDLTGQLPHPHYFFCVDSDVGRLTRYPTN